MDQISTSKSHSWKCVINRTIFDSKSTPNTSKIQVELFSQLTSKSNRSLVDRKWEIAWWNSHHRSALKGQYWKRFMNHWLQIDVEFWSNSCWHFLSNTKSTSKLSRNFIDGKWIWFFDHKLTSNFHYWKLVIIRPLFNFNSTSNFGWNLIDFPSAKNCEFFNHQFGLPEYNIHYLFCHQFEIIYCNSILQLDSVTNEKQLTTMFFAQKNVNRWFISCLELKINV